MRLFRLGRVARALHRFLESSFALLFLMLSFYMVVAHWFACVWYVIGMEDLKTGINFGWLSSLATITKKPFYLGMMHSFFTYSYSTLSNRRTSMNYRILRKTLTKVL